MNDHSRVVQPSFHFRVHGLPTDVKRPEVHKVMVDLGLKDVSEGDFRQVYIKDTGIPGIRTYMVDFKIFWSEGNEGDESSAREKTKLIGEHQVIIGEYIYPIKIICFGFCNVCKEDGHNAAKCSVRIQRNEERLLKMKCDLCHQMGHYKMNCPRKDSIIQEKKNNTRCFNCRQLGHYKSQCTSNGPEWESNPLISSVEMGQYVQDQFYEANNPDTVPNNANLDVYNYTKKIIPTIKNKTALIDNNDNKKNTANEKETNNNNNNSHVTKINVVSIIASNEQTVVNNNNNIINDDVIINATSTSTPSAINNNNNSQDNIDPTIETMLASIANNAALGNEPSGNKRPCNLLSENLSENLQKKAAVDTSNQSNNTSAGADGSMNDTDQF